MRASNLLLATLREAPAEAEIASHRLLFRAGMVRQLAAGIYTWLPSGLRVLRKVENIVRGEMNRAGAQEVLLPGVQPGDLWRESGRWDQYGPELLRLQDRHQRDFCLGPTHEEVITDLVRREVRSYKQLPANFYQIQTKFRDEIRPRFGILRAREFIMKDSYSFHLNQDSLRETYALMYEAYGRVFNRCGLEYRAVEADSGNIGGSVSHEFHVLADSGEDRIAFSDSGDFAANLELLDGKAKAGDPSPDGKGKLCVRSGIEVGHIFQLGTKYSEAMQARCLDENGEAVTLFMGCYGIGISRIVAAAIEQHHDERGIIWPDGIAPWQLALIPVNMRKSQRLREAVEKLFAALQEAGIDTLLDDRKERLGVMLTEQELLGIPHRIVFSEKGLDSGMLEYRRRGEADNREVALDGAVKFLLEQIGGGETGGRNGGGKGKSGKNGGGEA